MDGENLSFDVTVTNTGSVAGKDVVEVYFNPPYTNGGIEKASANLVRYEKTGLLNPGESETIHISFDLEDMASYDERCRAAMCWKRAITSSPSRPTPTPSWTARSTPSRNRDL